MVARIHIAYRSSKLYEKLIYLYPSSYLKKHREELLQNFEDLEHDLGPRHFLWAFIISDLFKSLFLEYMQYIRHHRWAQFAIVILVILAVLFALQVAYLQKAHSTFDNYAAFRGCAQITSRTDTQGSCLTSSGETVTIVKFDNRWFLQGDLPECMIGFGSYCLMSQP